jgi:hypothetical protein
MSDSRILPQAVPAGCPRKKQHNAKAKEELLAIMSQKKIIWLVGNYYHP